MNSNEKFAELCMKIAETKATPSRETNWEKLLALIDEFEVLKVQETKKEMIEKINTLNDKLILKEDWKPEQLIAIQYALMELKKELEGGG